MTTNMNGTATTAMRARRGATWLSRCLLLLVGSLIGFLLAEVLLRVVGISYPLPYEPDPYCGARLRPGFAAWFTKEGSSFVRINRAGFRDRDHVARKPPDTVRIAVLGDSYAEALQVPLDQTFWSVLGRELTRRESFGSRRVEVLNFGVSGYGTAQELQALRHYVWDYSPDIVLLAFLAGNDVRNNSIRLEPDKARPFFELRGDRLVLNDSFLAHPDFQKASSRWIRLKVGMINASRVLQLANEWKQRITARGSGTRQNRDVDAGVFQAELDEPWREAWQITERIVQTMHRECDEHHARFCVALITEGFQVHPDPRERKRLQAERGILDPRIAEQRLESWGRRDGYAVIPLSGALGDYARTNDAYLHGFANTRWGDGHWNALGHRLAGERIAEAIDALVRGGSAP